MSYRSIDSNYHVASLGRRIFSSTPTEGESVFTISGEIDKRLKGDFVNDLLSLTVFLSRRLLIGSESNKYNGVIVNGSNDFASGNSVLQFCVLFCSE